MKRSIESQSSQMRGLQQVLVALRRAFAVCARSELVRCQRVIEHGKLVLSAGRPEDRSAILVPSSAVVVIAVCPVWDHSAVCSTVVGKRLAVAWRGAAS